MERKELPRQFFCSTGWLQDLEFTFLALEDDPLPDFGPTNVPLPLLGVTCHPPRKCS